MLIIKDEDFEPRIMVAMPALQDLFFKKNIVLLCEYDTEGAMGFVVNRQSETTVRAMLQFLNIDGDFKADVYERKVHIGGPVQPDMMWVIHPAEITHQSTCVLTDSLAISALVEFIELTDYREQYIEKCIFGVGYSGWGPGQLGTEIENNSWWLTDLHVLKILEASQDSNYWEKIVHDLGLHGYSEIGHA